jgi:hypothetical protein
VYRCRYSGYLDVPLKTGGDPNIHIHYWLSESESDPSASHQLHRTSAPAAWHGAFAQHAGSFLRTLGCTVLAWVYVAGDVDLVGCECFGCCRSVGCWMMPIIVDIGFVVFVVGVKVL